MKGLGNGAGGLADLRIDYEKTLGGVGDFCDTNKLLAQFFIETVTTGGVDNQNVGCTDGLDSISNDFDSVSLVWFSVDFDR